MNIDTVTAILNQAIQVTLLVSMPSVGLGLAIGLIVAVFQAVTQIQEQTLTFVPKMVVVMIVIGATFPWMSRLVMEMALGLWENIPLYSQ
ncbi:flagellar biosynthetic protein FliQ [bacterium]|jgi:flagellar biosynthesis protein FliQ|nr:flagellar biosynthetic protein FliQ [bacterium]